MFKTFDGLNLFERSWKPKGETKAVVAIVHGYAEHSGYYDSVADPLKKEGYAVYAFDLRGHGQSQGKRAFVHSFDEYLLDLKYFSDRVGKQAFGKPVFLLGHSLGGTIAALFAITYQRDIRGLILSGSLLKIPDSFSPLFLKLLSIASRIFPNLPVVKKIDERLISRDPEVVSRYDSDPLVYRGWMVAKEAEELRKAVIRIQQDVKRLSLPILILHGASDGLVDVKGSELLYAAAGSKDKTLKLYEGFYHEIFNDPEKEIALRDLIAWIEAHL